MAIRFRNLILSAFFCSLSLFSGSDTFAQQAEARPDSASVDFTVYANRYIKGLFFGKFGPDGKITESVPVKFRTGGRSNSYQYYGPRTIYFYTESPSLNEGGNEPPKRTPVARVTIPTNAKKLLFIFLRADDETAEFPYKVIAIDDSAASLPWGNLKVLNLSQNTYVGKVGTEASISGNSNFIEIVPGQNRAVPFVPSGSVQIAAQLYGDDWNLVYQNQFACSANERLLFLLYPPLAGGSKQLRGEVIRERRKDDDSNRY